MKYRNWRINLVLLFVILFGTVIMSRLFVLQILNHDFYKALYHGQQKNFAQIQGERGEIFLTDKKGNLYPLAVNQNKNGETKRYYPQDFLASSVVGFLGGEGIGQYGLEDYYNDILKGEEKFQEGERSPWVDSFSIKKIYPSKGADIILTIDYNIQFRAEELLKQAREDFNIEGGQIIVMDPVSGKIFAMADFPNFNPNQYAQEQDFEIFKNGSIQKIFEPGSVFKAITMAAALDQKKITPQTSYIDKGIVKIGGYTISNYGQKVWGESTMIDVLEKSINTGAIFAQKQIGNKIFLDYIEKFGFFEKTGIDLQGEIFSSNKELRKGYEINFATASFGQGIEVTPIQLVSAYAAIANGGNLIKPCIIEKIIWKNKDKEAFLSSETIRRQNVISSRTASHLTAMLCSVVKNGFGKKAQIPGYYIAGKTGTGQISWGALGINKEGYSEKTWQSFIGFGPAFNPRFLILVKLDNPMTKTAEYSAIPIFQNLAKYIIDYLEIPPDYE